MRPTIQDVFGGSSAVLQTNDSVNEPGLFLPWSSFQYEGSPSQDPPDAQVLFARLLIKVSQMLNESNRNSDRESIVSTVSYAEYDKIFDPPGSQNLTRRDVFSVLFYDEEPAIAFDPDSLI